MRCAPPGSARPASTPSCCWRRPRASIAPGCSPAPNSRSRRQLRAASGRWSGAAPAAGAARLHHRAPWLPADRARGRSPGARPAARDRAARRAGARARARTGARRRDRLRSDRARCRRRAAGRVGSSATDVSAQALDVARANAAALGLAGRVTFELGSLPAGGGSFDLVLANLPYVADGEWAGLQPEITQVGATGRARLRRRRPRRDPRAARGPRPRRRHHRCSRRARDRSPGRGRRSPRCSIRPATRPSRCAPISPAWSAS